MKKLFIIALLAVTASGCALRTTKNVEKPGPVIGMSVEAFKTSYPRADLVYLTTDSATYKIYRSSGGSFWIDDFYYFGRGKV